jgi:hypothetical protein
MIWRCHEIPCLKQLKSVSDKNYLKENAMFKQGITCLNHQVEKDGQSRVQYKIDS